MRNRAYNARDANVGAVMFEILRIPKLSRSASATFGGDGTPAVWSFCIYFSSFYLMSPTNSFVESRKRIINIFETPCLIFFGEGYIKTGKTPCYGARED